jgi:tRNA dimethylallyltransferase
VTDPPLDEVPTIICVVGPTAIGKSRLAVALAEHIGGEIISADSRQVYRYMDIGTDKPGMEERSRVRHHLLDVVAPDEPYSAQRFAAEGRAVLRRLAAQGRLAIVAGGTGFYLRALIDGLTFPPVQPDPELRARLYREAEEAGGEFLHARLAARDPRSAARIHPHNLPRLVRALEIVETTGRPVPPVSSAASQNALRIGLETDRAHLQRLADERIHRQIQLGLVEETRLLLAMEYDPSLPALQGFGYREMGLYLRGEIPLDVAVARYKTATHQYIRRQLTWFRADDRVRWLPANDDLEARATQLTEAWVRGQR